MQAADNILPGTSDRECLEFWAQRRDVGSLQTLVERYLAFVYSSAFRRTGDATQAAEVTRAVFLVLARRARRLRKKTVLAGWLFHVTGVAGRKVTRNRFGQLRRLWQRICRKPRAPDQAEWMEICGAKGVDTSPLARLADGGGEGNLDATLWSCLAPQMDRALERLRTKQRDAVLLCAFLNHDFASAARVLGTSERRVAKRVGQGMTQLGKQLGERCAPMEHGALAAACATEG